MDRRHRPFLSFLMLLAGGSTVLPPTGNLWAQNATPAPTASESASPAPSATPWVQASPPPGQTATATPRPPRPPKPMASPPVPPSSEDVSREMARRRMEEQQHEQITDKAAQQGVKDGKKQAARLDQLPPDERAAYQRNLPLWRQLPEEERDVLRQRADERIKQETDKAYQESGLTLDHDQREVFDLRYRQERRKVERELQEKASAERARRLAEVSDRLKHEFKSKPSPQGTDMPAPKKAPAPTPANPDASPVPGFMR